MTDSSITRRAVASSLWAAYGDALGFISELVDERGLARRLGGRVRRPASSTPELWRNEDGLSPWPLERTQSWSRRVGGRGGATVELPAGVYSDDTQLRLATSRSIDRGTFDVETFSKVELTVFPSYALGAGRSTKAACQNLTRPTVRWFNNSYDGYLEAGGNGVLMRVQPHAWTAAANSSRQGWQRDLLIDTLKNGLATHGHMRALVPACLHALLLAQEVRSGNPSSDRALAYCWSWLEQVPDFVEADERLGLFFLPVWDSLTRKPFRVAWLEILEEQFGQLEIVRSFVEHSPSRPDADLYRQLLDALGLLQPQTRGSGTASFSAAWALSTIFRESPGDALLLAVNALGSDTDSIATVAGAHLGATSHAMNVGPLLDADYIALEAERVASEGESTSVSYPDLLHWQPPATQADVLVDADGQWIVSGLGPCAPLQVAPIAASGSGGYLWQWVRLEFGQTMLVKRRGQLVSLGFKASADRGERVHIGEEARAALHDSGMLRHRMERAGAEKQAVMQGSPTRRAHRSGPSNSASEEGARPLSVDEAIAVARTSGWDDATVGGLLLRLARESSYEATVAFAAGLTAGISPRGIVGG